MHQTRAVTAPHDVLDAAFVAAAQRFDQLPPAEGDEVAFAGRSNVGKSSVMNALMGRRKLVRTSATPGCTRQIALFRARARDGRVFHLVDLPGYGYARRSKDERGQWAELIERYLLERAALRAVVVLVDARRGVEEEERQLLAFIAARPEPRPTAIVVATKIDKLPKSRRKAALDAIGAARVEDAEAAPSGSGSGRAKILAVSATDGEGIPALWSAIRAAKPA